MISIAFDIAIGMENRICTKCSHGQFIQFKCKIHDNVYNSKNIGCTHPETGQIYFARRIFHARGIDCSCPGSSLVHLHKDEIKSTSESTAESTSESTTESK